MRFRWQVVHPGQQASQGQPLINRKTVSEILQLKFVMVEGYAEKPHSIMSTTNPSREICWINLWMQLIIRSLEKGLHRSCSQYKTNEIKKSIRTLWHLKYLTVSIHRNKKPAITMTSHDPQGVKWPLKRLNSPDNPTACSLNCSDQQKVNNLSSALMAFCEGESTGELPGMSKDFPCHDVFMWWQ